MREAFGKTKTPENQERELQSELGHKHVRVGVENWVLYTFRKI